MSREGLVEALRGALAELSDAEFDLFALAVLHGVPIKQIDGAPQTNVELVVGAQKKLRKHLTEAGFGIADLEKPKKKGR